MSAGEVQQWRFLSRTITDPPLPWHREACMTVGYVRLYRRMHTYMYAHVCMPDTPGPVKHAHARPPARTRANTIEPLPRQDVCSSGT